MAAAALLVVLSLANRDGEAAPALSLDGGTEPPNRLESSPNPEDPRASLGGRVLAIETDHFVVDRGGGQFLVHWTPDTTLLKADGAPTYQLVTSRGLSRLRLGDSIDMVGVWTGSAEFQADVVNANLWIHRPGIVTAIGDTTIGLRIPQGEGAPFPDEATTLPVDRARFSWPPTRLAVGDQVQFEAAQADDGSLILTGILDPHPVASSSLPP